MQIIKHGNCLSNPKLKGVCFCGCEFICFLSEAIPADPHDPEAVAYVKCPECKREVELINYREK